MGLWVLWDWTIAAGGGQRHATNLILDALDVQCGSYRDRGMPTLETLGSAPFEAHVEIEHRYFPE